MKNEKKLRVIGNKAKAGKSIGQRAWGMVRGTRGREQGAGKTGERRKETGGRNPVLRLRSATGNMILLGNQ